MAVKYVSPIDYAQLNCVSRMTVYRMLKEDQIPGVIKFRGQWRIPVDLDSLSETCATKQQAYIWPEDTMPERVTINGVVYVRLDCQDRQSDEDVPFDAFMPL